MKKGELGVSVGIVGTGRVGTALAFALLTQKIANEIVLVGHHFEEAEGEAMDLDHGSLFTQAAIVRAGDYKDLKGMDFIVFTAGASQKPGETRLDLLNSNINIFKDIVPKTFKYNKKATYIIVSNPVDILTYITLKLTGLPSNQVIGSGTTLDSSRFRYLLAKNLKVSSHNVHAYILGEHGDSEMPALSTSYISGVPLKSFPGATNEVIKSAFDHTKNAAYEVIQRKGSTFWAIGICVAGMIDVMKYDDHTIMPVSTLLNGEYGIKDVCLSVPSRLGASGREDIIELPLSKKELTQLQNSAKVLKEALKKSCFYAKK
jgi:L-lactate dehydrogenase